VSAHAVLTQACTRSAGWLRQVVLALAAASELLLLLLRVLLDMML
jgi:hypothetical protein